MGWAASGTKVYFLQSTGWTFKTRVGTSIFGSDKCSLPDLRQRQFLVIPTHGRKRKASDRALWGAFYGVQVSFMRFVLSWPNHPLKAPPPNIITWVWDFNIGAWGRSRIQAPFCPHRAPDSKASSCIIVVFSCKSPEMISRRISKMWYSQRIEFCAATAKNKLHLCLCVCVCVFSKTEHQEKNSSFK